jgi:recombination protein RecA
LSDKDINDGEVYGHETIFSIEKNKLAAPFKEARVNLIYGKGYDIYHELAVLATDLGIFDKRGSWYKYKDNNIANGERAISVFLEENVDLFNEVKDEVMASVGLKEIYERHQR